MKPFIFTLFVASVALFSCKKDQKNNKPVINSLTTASVLPPCPFTGSWGWEKNDRKNSFSVSMVQKKDSIYGTYCALVRGGAKIDCGGVEGTNPTVSFVAPVPQGNTFEASFRNYFTGDEGKVKMSLYDGDMHWMITQEPKGECYAFRNALMKRKTEIWVTAKEDGSIKLGDRPVKIENLQQALTDTIQFMMKNFSKKPDTIGLQSDVNVQMGTRSAIQNVINSAKF